MNHRALFWFCLPNVLQHVRAVIDNDETGNDYISHESHKKDKDAAVRQMAEADPLFCDSIIADEHDAESPDSAFVCVVSTDHVWNTDLLISITPTTIRTGGDINRPLVPTETITALHIQRGTTLTCNADFCELALLEFSSIRVDGTLHGSKITIHSLGNIAMDSSSGTIDTIGRGYGPQQGPGAGFITGGGVLTSCSKHNRIAASHGGVGGRYCNSVPPNLAPTYDNGATDYGSGGASSCNGELSFGGGVVDLVAETTISIAIGSRILANASPSTFCAGGCSGGSGGSIRLTATSIVGGGNIMANGGSASSSGGGGRIIITADVFERSRFLIQADGGEIADVSTNEPVCVEAIGGDSAIVVRCKTGTCFNEGTPRGEGQCGCTCVSPWSGKDCRECTKTCQNNGIVDESKCTCDCPNEWIGEQCLSCNSNYLCNGGKGRCSVVNTNTVSEATTFECTCDNFWYGSKCENYCNRDINCTSNGLCSSDGSKCICMEGKVGSDCFCDKEPATICSSAQACSGNGICQNGECFCGPGWVGCKCDIPCNSETDCNGNGQCNLQDGTCICNAGFTGPNCVQDPNSYCAKPSETKSGYPCIPGVLNVLGHGYDAISGTLTNPVIQLTFTEGRTFTLAQGKTYELPDGVTCSPKTDTTSTFSTRVFRSTQDFRYYLATKVGLSGSYKPVFFSASAEYTEALERSFTQNRALYTSDLNHGMYECSLVDSVLRPPVSSDAIIAYESLSGSRRVQALGTHYIRRALLGGRVSIFNYVDICVFGELSMHEVSVEVEASVFKLAGAPSASGSVDTYTGSSCSVYSKNAFFSKTVNGGDRSLLIVPDGANSVQDLRDWFKSLDFALGYIRLQLNPIDFVFEDLKEDVTTYVEAPSVVEYDQNENLHAVGINGNPVVCATKCAPQPSSATSALPKLTIRAVVVVVHGMLFSFVIAATLSS